MLLATFGGLNFADMVFQLLFWLLPLGTLILMAFLLIRKRDQRMKRIEEKLDQLLSDKER